MMVEVRIELDAKFLIYQPDYTERQYQHIRYPSVWVAAGAMLPG